MLPLLSLALMVTSAFGISKCNHDHVTDALKYMWLN